MPVMGRAFAVFVVVSAAAGCAQQSPTSPPPSTVVPVQVAGLTLSAPEQPLVAGTTVSLKAIARMSDGTEVAVFDGAQWVSENPDVARVDTRGTLDVVREGETTVSVGVKGASASVTVTVVMNMTGVWSITYIPVSCHSIGGLPGCEGRHPRPATQIDSVTLSQIGDRVSGEWLRMPVEGRIAPGGRLVLNGHQCYTSDYGPADEQAIENWHMERSDTDRFSGRAHWQEYSWTDWDSCTGTRSRSSQAGDLEIIDFRRR